MPLSIKNLFGAVKKNSEVLTKDPNVNFIKGATNKNARHIEDYSYGVNIGGLANEEVADIARQKAIKSYQSKGTPVVEGRKGVAEGGYSRLLAKREAAVSTGSALEGAGVTGTTGATSGAVTGTSAPVIGNTPSAASASGINKDMTRLEAAGQIGSNIGNAFMSGGASQVGRWALGGAAIGGVSEWAQGGDFIEGAKSGAWSGAWMGGVATALKHGGFSTFNKDRTYSEAWSQNGRVSKQVQNIHQLQRNAAMTKKALVLK